MWCRVVGIRTDNRRDLRARTQRGIDPDCIHCERPVLDAISRDIDEVRIGGISGDRSMHNALRTRKDIWCIQCRPIRSSIRRTKESGALPARTDDRREDRVRVRGTVDRQQNSAVVRRADARQSVARVRPGGTAVVAPKNTLPTNCGIKASQIVGIANQ